MLLNEYLLIHCSSLSLILKYLNIYMTKHDLVLKAIIGPDWQSLRQVWERDIGYVSFNQFKLIIKRVGNILN